jgi:flagellar biosynthesis/type III secretory pathway protein FliH
MFYDLAKPFEVLDAEVERELLTLAMALARQIVRRELKTDPTQIIGIIREAIAALPVAAARCACICIRRMPRWCATISRRPKASAPGP